MTWRRRLHDDLAGIDIRDDEPLSRHTSFRIGGPAEAMVTVRDERELAAVVKWCADSGVRVQVLGRGTNVLVSDQGLGGVVLRLAGTFAGIEPAGVTIMAGGGALLDRIVDAAEANGLTGAEFLAGIPGTLGGGLQTNAGAFGHSLYELVESVDVMDRQGRTCTVTRDGCRKIGDRECPAKAGLQLRNQYRSPVVPRDLIVLRAVLRLRTGRPEPAQALRESRWQKHPAEPSAGSFFKNPTTEPAGRLIERCGLKGMSAGGACVSEKHANFIVNRGDARFRDVYELAEVVKATVEEMTGVLLEEEVRIMPGLERIADSQGR
uniref:UDP-N-acetylenolpyruvoylglucosamine reductase n=1 Tax=candidate division WOR-3 bacterium TaxID=2052148 RepID=A0A7C4CB10_UNCW3